VLRKSIQHTMVETTRALLTILATLVLEDRLLQILNERNEGAACSIADGGAIRACSALGSRNRASNSSESDEGKERGEGHCKSDWMTEVRK
jgi:hypothetical protein